MSERHNKPGCFLTVTPIIGLLWATFWMVL